MVYYLNVNATLHPLAIFLRECVRSKSRRSERTQRLDAATGHMMGHTHHHEKGSENGSHPISWGLAVDFANTVACKACRSSDTLSSPEAFERWNHDHPGLPEVGTSTATRRRLTDLRRDIREILERQTAGKPPDPAALARLNRMLRESSTHLRAVFDAGQWRFEEIPEHVTTRQEWMWRVTRATADLLGGEQAGKLLRCQAPTCDHYVVRRMRDQLWCSPACGNRIRVARHYAKVRRQVRNRGLTKRAR